MTDTIEQQIEAGRKQAEEKKIFEKTRWVAENLGKATTVTWHGLGDGTSVTNAFNDAASSLVVSYIVTTRPGQSFEEPLARVIFNGREVFTASGASQGKIEFYELGDWEKKLNTLYAQEQKASPKTAPKVKLG